jgi:hypothetical protein
MVLMLMFLSFGVRAGGRKINGRRNLPYTPLAGGRTMDGLVGWWRVDGGVRAAKEQRGATRKKRRFRGGVARGMAALPLLVRLGIASICVLWR